MIHAGTSESDEGCLPSKCLYLFVWLAKCHFLFATTVESCQQIFFFDRIFRNQSSNNGIDELLPVNKSVIKLAENFHDKEIKAILLSIF